MMGILSLNPGIRWLSDPGEVALDQDTPSLVTLLLLQILVVLFSPHFNLFHRYGSKFAAH